MQAFGKVNTDVHSAIKISDHGKKIDSYLVSALAFTSSVLMWMDVADCRAAQLQGRWGVEPCGHSTVRPFFAKAAAKIAALACGQCMVVGCPWDSH